MKVIFEHPTIIFDNDIAEIIIEFVNHILYADSEEILRQIVAGFADKYDLDRYFVYGYGSHHLWLKQKNQQLRYNLPSRNIADGATSSRGCSIDFL